MRCLFFFFPLIQQSPKISNKNILNYISTSITISYKTSFLAKQSLHQSNILYLDTLKTFEHVNFKTQRTLSTLLYISQIFKRFHSNQVPYIFSYTSIYTSSSRIVLSIPFTAKPLALPLFSILFYLSFFFSFLPFFFFLFVSSPPTSHTSTHSHIAIASTDFSFLSPYANPPLSPLISIAAPFSEYHFFFSRHLVLVIPPNVPQIFFPLSNFSP